MLKLLFKLVLYIFKKLKTLTFSQNYLTYLQSFNAFYTKSTSTVVDIVKPVYLTETLHFQTYPVTIFLECLKREISHGLYIVLSLTKQFMYNEYKHKPF